MVPRYVSNLAKNNVLKQHFKASVNNSVTCAGVVCVHAVCPVMGQDPSLCSISAYCDWEELGVCWHGSYCGFGVFFFIF